VIHHSDAVLANWPNLSLAEQLANVGSEVSRAAKWQGKDKGIADRAYERMLELLNATILCQTERPALKELTRVRELMNASYYQESPVMLSEFNKYFFPFAVLANKHRQS
jgi:hypothetical protein